MVFKENVGLKKIAWLLLALLLFAALFIFVYVNPFPAMMEAFSPMFGGGKIELTKNEYRILLGLMQSKGRTVSREKLMELLWESDEFVDDNTLTVNVGRLRKKLEAAGLRDFITTKHGVGYLVQ